MEKQTYFITGATGLIGQHLVNALIEQKMVVYAASRNMGELEKRWEEEVKHNQVIPVEWSMERSIPENLPMVDYIIHAAAVIPGRGMSEDDILKSNLEGINHILEFAGRNLNEKLIFLSSASVYGKRLNQNSIPIREEEAEMVKAVELDAYGLSKRMTEEILGKLYKRRINSNAVRPFKVYGEGTIPNRQGDVIQNLLWQALYADEIMINGNARAVRNFLYVTDAVRIILMLCKEKCAHWVYNIGSFSENFSIYEYADILAELSGKRVVYNEEIAFEGSAQIPDLSRLSRLKDMNMVTFQEGVVRMYNGCKGLID